MKIGQKNIPETVERKRATGYCHPEDRLATLYYLADPTEAIACEHCGVIGYGLATGWSHPWIKDVDLS